MTKSFKINSLAVLGALSIAVFSGGCIVVAEPGVPLRYIEAIEVCSHVYDSVGPLSYYDARFQLVGYNDHLGEPYDSISPKIELDGDGRTTPNSYLHPCVRFELGAASDYEDNDAISNPRLEVTCDGRHTGAQPYGRPQILFDGASGFNYYYMRINADFNLDLYADSSKNLRNYMIKEQLHRIKDKMTGNKTATKEGIEESKDNKNVPSRNDGVPNNNKEGKLRAT